MSITVTTEKQFESDVEAFLISDEVQLRNVNR